MGVTLERGQQGIIRLPALRAQQDGGADQRACLVDVHLFQFRQGERLADACQVYGLAARHAARAARHGEQFDHFKLAFRVVGQGLRRHQLKCEGLQGVADQQRGGFIVFHMAGGFAAPEHVVVHAGQVVMHQGIGVDQFDRGGGDADARRIGAGEFAGGIGQQGAHALAAFQHAVTHGLVQALGSDVGRGQQAAQQHFEVLLVCGRPGLEVLAGGIRHRRLQEG